MSKVLILSKTKMLGGRVCVGGVDLDARCSIRLLDSEGHHETQDECPYELLSVWNVEYSRNNRRSAPHLEDVNVVKREPVGTIVKPKELTKLRHYNVKMYNSPLLEVFDGKLSSTEHGSLYIDHEKGVTEYSTCFWTCDRNLRKNRYSTEQKIKYDYRDSDGRWYHITYVGVDHIPDIIPAGSLIRLSLAHWWHPEGDDVEDRCYLQLSGFFSVVE